MQAASSPPVAIRCKRSYVFSMGGHYTGGTTRTLNIALYC